MTAPKNRPEFCPKCGGTDFTAANNCRPCHRARVKAYLQSDAGKAFKERRKPKRTAYNLAYWAATKADVQAKADEDRAAGRPTDAAVKAAKYKDKHPDRLAESQAKFYASEKGAVYRWSNAAWNGLRHRSAITLSASELRDMWRTQGGVCPLTHRTMKIDGVGYSLDAPSLDRIDPTKGYVGDNVRIVTFQANSARRDGTDADLYDFCSAVLAHRDKPKP